MALATRHHRWAPSASIPRSVVMAVITGLVLAGCGYSDPAAAPPPDTPSTTSSYMPTSTSTSTVPVSVATSSTIPPMDLQSADLKAGPYQVLCPGGPVSASPAAGTATTADGRRAVIDRFDAQFSDLTGDGRPDAVVSVNCRVAADGTAGSDSVIVLTASGKTVKQLGQPIDGSEPVVVGQSLAVRQVTTAGTADAAAPTTQPAGAPAPTQPGGVATTIQPATVPALAVRYDAFTLANDAWTRPTATAEATAKDPVTIDGVDPYLVGTPYGEVALASGQPVDVADPLHTNGACVDVTYPSGPGDISSLGSDGTVRSLEVRNSSMRTPEGIGVGSGEADVAQAYAGGVKVMDNPAVAGGHLLVVRLSDAPDRTMMFTTDGQMVTKYAVGQAGWADVLKGCS